MLLYESSGVEAESENPPTFAEIRTGDGIIDWRISLEALRVLLLAESVAVFFLQRVSEQLVPLQIYYRGAI
jgi:hypothetical protein